MAKQGRGSEQAMIRLPDGMRDRLKASADQSGRSMNAEIVARIEDSFQHAMAKHGDIPELVGKYVDTLDRQFAALKEKELIAKTLVSKLALAIQKAADGDPSELEEQIEHARRNPGSWKSLITVFSSVDEA